MTFEQENEQVPELEETEEQKSVDVEPTKEEYKNSKEKMYDKIPLSYKQADILVKVLIAACAIFIIWVVIKSNLTI